MLYTIMPHEIIYPEKISVPKYRIVNGIMTETRCDSFGRSRLSRIYTTNLKYYLNKEFYVI